MPRPSRSVPRELVDDWPATEASDPIVEVARRFAVTLRAAIGERSVRGAAQDAGVDHTTILNVLAGRSWPDLATIARLERGLGTALWPGADWTPPTG